MNPFGRAGLLAEQRDAGELIQRPSLSVEEGCGENIRMMPLDAQQHGHLRAALDLEAARRIGLADQGTGPGIFSRDCSRIQRYPLAVFQHHDGTRWGRGNAFAGQAIRDVSNQATKRPSCQFCQVTTKSIASPSRRAADIMPAGSTAIAK